MAVDHYGEVLARTSANLDAIAALETLLGESELRARVAELLEPAFRTIRDLRKLSGIRWRSGWRPWTIPCGGSRPCARSPPSRCTSAVPSRPWPRAAGPGWRM
jgi:hypothetical protein